MKNRIKIRLMAGLFALICMITFPDSVRAEDYWPSGPPTESKSAVVMEVNTGTILYEKKSHKKHYPASITKIMTTLLAIENCDMDEKVVFSEDAVFKNEGETSNIARNLGEELTVEQCLYAVMLESANECAYAVAEHIGEKLGGDYRTFIKLMNKRARELGCKNTHFNNSNGLPDENHWVSAYDMALISAEAYKNKEFRKITGTTAYTLPKTNKCKEEFPCHNHHKMIYPFRGDYDHLYEYCTGGKTGYTSEANSTLVSFAEKDGITLVCVVMDVNSPGQYTDTRSLFDYCFDNFRTFNIAENDAVLSKSEGKDVGLMNNNEPYAKLDTKAYIILPKSAKFSDASFEEDKENTDDDVIAKLKYTYAGHVVGRADIIQTGTKIENNYFSKKKTEQEDNSVRIIWLKPEMFGIAFLILFVIAVVIYLAKKLYDNFYLIRHERMMRKNDRERFKVNRPRKRRRRDRMFH